MARLHQRQDSGRGEGGSLQGALDSLSAALRFAGGQFDHAGRLPRLLSGSEEGRIQRQHDQDRPRIATGLSSQAIRYCGTTALDGTSFKAARQLADKRTGQNDCRFERHSAHQAFYNAGPSDRGEGRGHSRSDLGSGGLCARHDRLSATGPQSDKQAAHRSANGKSRAGRAGRSLRGASDRQRGRVRRQAGRFRKEGHSTAERESWDTVLATHPSPHLCGLDGAGQCTDAAYQPVSGAHIASDDRAGLCPVLTLIYEGCERRDRVLVYRRTFGVCRYTHLSSCKCWWALTGSNRRPSRCKLRVPLQIWGFHAKYRKHFRNIDRFCSRYVSLDGTHVHIGRQRDWYSRAALNTER